jgi:hypothetical protein
MDSKEEASTSRPMISASNSDNILTIKPDSENSGVAEQLEHADEIEDGPIDIIKSTVPTIDNPSLPVFTYVLSGRYVKL